MTTEEKLQHFYDIAVGEAQEESDTLLAQHRDELDQQLSNYKIAKQRDMEIQLKAESDRVSREINKALSVSQLDIKRKWIKRKNKLTSQLFAEVRTKLENYMSTDAYVDYLERCIKEALDFAGSDTVSFYLSPEDTSKAETLSSKTGVTLEIADASFIGGLKATIPSKNILIDHTFASALEEQQAAFSFDGGLNYE